MYSSRHNPLSRQHGGPGPRHMRDGRPRQRLSGAAPIPPRPFLSAARRAEDAGIDRMLSELSTL